MKLELIDELDVLTIYPCYAEYGDEEGLDAMEISSWQMYMQALELGDKWATFEWGDEEFGTCGITGSRGRVMRLRVYA